MTDSESVIKVESLNKSRLNENYLGHLLSKKFMTLDKKEKGRNQEKLAETNNNT
jgi:hypothetical protein